MSLGEPSLVNRVLSAKTALAPLARSMAPPTAGMASGAPVCQFARSPGERHLESAQYADIEVPAAHHREGSGVIEIGRAASLGNRNLAGIDQVRIDVSARTPADQLPTSRSRCARSPRCRG
jgi:hypothetical protein